MRKHLKEGVSETLADIEVKISRDLKVYDNGRLFDVHNHNDDTQRYPFYKFQLVVETFGHSTNTPTNKKILFETLGTTAPHSELVKMLMFPLLTKNIDNVRSSGKKTATHLMWKNVT